MIILIALFFFLVAPIVLWLASCILCARFIYAYHKKTWDWNKLPIDDRYGSNSGFREEDHITAAKFGLVFGVFALISFLIGGFFHKLHYEGNPLMDWITRKNEAKPGEIDPDAEPTKRQLRQARRLAKKLSKAK